MTTAPSLSHQTGREGGRTTHLTRSPRPAAGAVGAARVLGRGNGNSSSNATGASRGLHAAACTPLARRLHAACTRRLGGVALLQHLHGTRRDDHLLRAHDVARVEVVEGDEVEVPGWSRG